MVYILEESSISCPCNEYITPAMVEIMTLVFQRLADVKFLVACEKCYTQNSNESFNYVVWGLVPKEQYSPSREISIATNLGVLQFQTGFEATYSKVVSPMNLDITDGMKETLIEWKEKQQWRKSESTRCFCTPRMCSHQSECLYGNGAQGKISTKTEGERARRDKKRAIVHRVRELVHGRTEKGGQSKNARTQNNRMGLPGSCTA